MFNFNKRTYLNSIMILLIHADSIMSIKKSHVFKFHYDSINSIDGFCNKLEGN